MRGKSRGDRKAADIRHSPDRMWNGDGRLAFPADAAAVLRVDSKETHAVLVDERGFRILTTEEVFDDGPWRKIDEGRDGGVAAGCGRLAHGSWCRLSSPLNASSAGGTCVRKKIIILCIPFLCLDRRIENLEQSLSAPMEHDLNFQSLVRRARQHSAQHSVGKGMHPDVEQLLSGHDETDPFVEW